MESPVAKDGKAVGEICARSNVVFAGYYEQPGTNRGGHLRRLLPYRRPRPSGTRFENIHIVDRKKDVIISGGENISSPEIEDCLYQNRGRPRMRRDRHPPRKMG